MEHVNIWGKSVKGSGLKSWLLKSVFAACVYNLWMERNQMIFQHKVSSHDLVILKTVTAIRDLLNLKRGVKKSYKNIGLCCSWSLSTSVFDPHCLV
ncbi:hypothetical protein RHMOL_Rhmol03G0093600 [Rhododendron molle]|uniref:Uncharacterized protein n=1 Tax=Rhododendron molle TaxID=49168 RepID=A0ACC0PBW5_RHOML|nr:hypothetical protein RHMOL_Rhmol03G0093600 [Rhododendron molle]